MKYSNEPMLEMFIFETSQLIEELEALVLSCERNKSFDEGSINEIFRIMHTIKGSSAMMMFENIASLSHSIEDLFYYLRDGKPDRIDCSALSDLIFDCIDFIKIEIEKIKNADEADGEVKDSIEDIGNFLTKLQEDNPSSDLVKDRKEVPVERQQYYITSKKIESSDIKNNFKALIFFEDKCGMENIRAFSVIHNLKKEVDDISFEPEDIVDSDDSSQIIQEQGFKIYIKTDLSYERIHEILMQTLFLKDLELIELDDDEIEGIFRLDDPKIDEPLNLDKPCTPEKIDPQMDSKEFQSITSQQSIISVNVSRLDRLMDLVGEMVIAEAMVIQNSDLKGLELDNFDKAARQLNKITSEIQDMVMSIRMVPLSATFHRMHRIVRDMCKKLGKEVDLEIIGEETEVDKNIIEHISDPLMHVVRNALDHGIEAGKDRISKGKDARGTITLEAKNMGSDVLVTVKDDGRGLDREKILAKAKANNLLYKAQEDMTDKEIWNLILLPGFSTKESASEFSGRGVGMDVVTKNIQAVGGTVSVDSIVDQGSTITFKIPLTLAIIDGMNISVGASRYTIPTIAIKESFRPEEEDIIVDPEGNEMIMVRGECHPIIRLHKIFKINNCITDFDQGIIIMVEEDEKSYCIFADALLGQQQIVVKLLPNYIRNFKKINGLAGCTLLGDGSISLIIDIAGLINRSK